MLIFLSMLETDIERQQFLELYQTYLSSISIQGLTGELKWGRWRSAPYREPQDMTKNA